MISTPGRICLRGRVHATYKKHIFGILCTSLSSLFVFPQPARYCRRNHYLRSFGSFGERAGGEGGRRTKEERTGTSINLRSGGRGGAPRPQTCRVVGENLKREKERAPGAARARACSPLISEPPIEREGARGASVAYKLGRILRVETWPCGNKQARPPPRRREKSGRRRTGNICQRMAAAAIIR